MTESSYDRLKSRLRPGQLLDLFLDQIQEACFFIKDTDYRFVTGNAALVRILGASSLDDIIGKTDLDFTADFLASTFRDDDRAVLEDGKALFNKMELVPTTETLEWRCTTKVPLYDMQDRIIALAGMTREINDSDEVYRDHPEMRTIVSYIQNHFRDGLTKADMARAAGVSISTVERRFRHIFGITPGHYARKIRLNAACKLIRETGLPLAEIAARCGFFDQAGMTHAFRSEINITPNRYRQRFSTTRSESLSAA